MEIIEYRKRTSYGLFLALQNRLCLCTQSVLLFLHIIFDHSSLSDSFLCPWLYYVSARGLLAYVCVYVSSRACVHVRMSCIFQTPVMLCIHIQNTGLGCSALTPTQCLPWIQQFISNQVCIFRTSPVILIMRKNVVVESPLHDLCKVVKYWQRCSLLFWMAVSLALLIELISYISPFDV